MVRLGLARMIGWGWGGAPGVSWEQGQCRRLHARLG